jgi:hypothetical protein
MARQSRSRESEESQPNFVVADPRSELARRLDTGYEYIDRMVAAGEDVTKLEEFWIQLLRQYEAVCEGLAEAA